MSAYESSLLSQVLPYHKRVFPLKPEFAFILDEDVHLRYRWFADQAEFEQKLYKVNPHELDIEAVYSHKAKENKKHSDFKALER